MKVSSALKSHPRVFDLAHRLRLVSAQSQTDPEELASLARFASGARLAVEVGTFMGVSAGVIAAALGPSGRLYCVDPYEGGDALLRIATRHLARRRLLPRIIFVRRSSADTAGSLPPSVDFCFVDGNHSYEGLDVDWALVNRILRPGGIVCLHDTNPTGDEAQWSPGAIAFYRTRIAGDSAFTHVHAIRSLNVLRRNAPS